MVVSLDSRLECLLVHVYAPNEQLERAGVFMLLRQVINDFRCPVLLGGDFNIVRFAEKVGVSLCKSAMSEFEDFINSLGLIDLPLVGGKFTWSNGRHMPSFSRLDRFLLSQEIFDVWPEAFQ
ncbi:hypothetical protein V6N13_110243 [Hibiscus sabdariffa]